MTRPYIKIELEGPKLFVDEDHPIPTPLPEALQSLLQGKITYERCAGSLSFGDELFFAWNLKTQEKLDPKGPLHKLGWRQNPAWKIHWQLNDKFSLKIPRDDFRPLEWPPSHLEIMGRSGHTDLVRIRGTEDLRLFHVTVDVFPTLPFKAKGDIWFEGWDIPDHYMVDAANLCWKGNGSGALLPCAIPKLLQTISHPQERNDLRKLLGMKEELPDWVRAARAAGWSPPPDWDESKYEVR